MCQAASIPLMVGGLRAVLGRQKGMAKENTFLRFFFFLLGCVDMHLTQLMLGGGVDILFIS
jgi:hypothetical protein